MIVIDGARRDHRRIGQAVAGGRKFGIAGEAGAVAGFLERHAFLAAAGVVAQVELVEAVDPAGDQQMVAVAGNAAQIGVAPGNQFRPFAGAGRVGRGDAEIDVIVVGQDPQLPCAASASYWMSGRRGLIIVNGAAGRRRATRTSFERIVAGRNEDQAVVGRSSRADRKGDVVLLLVQRDRLGRFVPMR